jgi:hypothetical protein
MRPLRVGVLSCCTVGGGIGTAMLSHLANPHVPAGIWLLPYAYSVVLAILLILLCSLCVIAVFGSPGRQGRALVVLCVLLGREVPRLPAADADNSADIGNNGADSPESQHDAEDGQ